LSDVKSENIENAEKTDSPNSGGRIDHDSTWKDLIKKFFPYLLKRAIPELYEEADISEEPAFLDKEFTDVVNTSDPGIHKNPRYADYVIKIPLKNGGAEFVILHIEVQGRGGRGNLAERMYHYKCLIYSHYRKEPAALAIITAGRRKKERYYSFSRFGTEAIYRYNNLVLSELDDEELVSSGNPIDLVLYAGKFAQRAKKEPQKFDFLRKAVELFDERGWSLDEKRNLFLFTEIIVNMKDKELITQFREFLEHRNREGKAMYVPLLLRDSAAEIEQRGREEGKLEVARNLLANGVSPDIIEKSAGLPVEKIRELMN
jgi:predicted transposase/invertase (TIGR01784 family)